MTATPLVALERFASLAEDFLVAAEDADVAAMDRIMAHRNRLLGRIRTPDEGGSGRSQDEDTRRRELLETILDLDRRAGKLLTDHRDDAGRELARLEGGRRGLGGYRHGPARHAKWIDARG